MNEKVGVVYQQLLKTANRKQQNTDNVHSLVENCDTMLEIYINISHFNKSEILKTVMSEFFFVKFLTWPRNYYNDNKTSFVIALFKIWLQL